jgi:hypothetical protein
MDFIRPLLFLLNILAVFTCILPWFAVLAYISRWQMRWTVDDLQNRLLAWASENGYSIIQQERPAKASLLPWVAGSGVLRWLVSPRQIPWHFDLRWRSVGICVPSLSTHVILEDRQRQHRRGTMTYFGSPMTGFWGGPIESRWEEDAKSAAPAQHTADATGADPLWDRWVDSP